MEGEVRVRGFIHSKYASALQWVFSQFSCRHHHCLEQASPRPPFSLPDQRLYLGTEGRAIATPRKKATSRTSRELFSVGGNRQLGSGCFYSGALAQGQGPGQGPGRQRLGRGQGPKQGAGPASRARARVTVQGRCQGMGGHGPGQG